MCGIERLLAGRLKHGTGFVLPTRHIKLYGQSKHDFHLLIPLLLLTTARLWKSLFWAWPRTKSGLAQNVLFSHPYSDLIPL